MAFETVYPNFRDLEGLADYSSRGVRDGFTGMMAIHPSQVAVINGVGLGRKPPVYLREGDTVELGIAGLGQQRQVVAAPLLDS